MAKKTVYTPLGSLVLSEEDGFLTGLDWGAAEEASSPVLEKAADELEAYFNGRIKKFSKPYNLKGTPFQKKLWQAMSEIPYGKTVSYGWLAEKLNTSARAVGQACGKNPLPIIVPCHRVLAANGKLGGYSGGLETKEKLLALERRFN
mgnify:CR=1 FL=1